MSKLARRGVFVPKVKLDVRESRERIGKTDEAAVSERFTGPISVISVNDGYGLETFWLRKAMEQRKKKEGEKAKMVSKPKKNPEFYQLRDFLSRLLEVKSSDFLAIGRVPNVLVTFWGHLLTLSLFLPNFAAFFSPSFLRKSYFWSKLMTTPRKMAENGTEQYIFS